MVLTIFKKDLRLMWPGVVLVALLQAGLAAFEIAKGPFGNTRSTTEFAKLAETERMLDGVVLIGIGLLIALVVQQDALPQIDLDWLVRPIRRQQLAAAKLAFFFGAIQLPMLLLDIVHGVAGGYGIGPALVSAVSRNLFFLVAVTVPLFAVAAMTRSVVEFIVGVGLLIGSVELLDRLVQYGFGILPLQSPFWNGLEQWDWILVTVKYLIIAGAAAAVLAVQYARRKTRLSRLIFAPLLLLGFSASYLPWPVLSGFQQAVSGGGSLALAIDPAGKVMREDGVLSVPIKLSGLRDGQRLVVDWAEVTAGGQPSEGNVMIGTDGPSGPWLERGLSGQAWVNFPEKAVSPALDVAVTVIEKQGESIDLAVSEDFQPVAGLGRCRVRDPGRQVPHVPLVAECAQAGRVASVTTMEAYSTGEQTPFAVGMTKFSYAPFFAQILPDGLNRVGVSMPPRTQTPTADLYPNSHVIVQNYRVVAHRQIHLTL